MSFQKGRKIRKHVDWPAFDGGFQGRGKILKEPVPNPLYISGYKEIKGNVDNNAKIVFSRDRDPFGKGNRNKVEAFDLDKLKSNDDSGYSNYMGAGAIDIVVGSGAPYPLDLGVKAPGPKNLPPLYTTAKTAQLSGFKLADGETNHPGILMDAARIYITQMGDVDNYFLLNSTGRKADLGPSSAIVMKADRLRFHSRRDIKIIAGGDPGSNIDSCGYTITEGGAIHLMADNGAAGPQQSLVLGDNLVKCIRGIYDVLQDNLEILNNLVISQMQLNAVIAPSIRVGGAGPTAFDPLSCIANMFKILSDWKDLINIWFNKFYNIPIAQDFNFTYPNGNQYILSRKNTTN